MAVATTRLLKKIINVLNNSKEPMTITKIKTYIGKSHIKSKIEDGLNFLVLYNIIEKSKYKNTTIKIYSIKDKKLLNQISKSLKEIQEGKFQVLE